MKVLHVAPLWWPIARASVGGIETFIAALLGELEAAGCRTVVVASGDSSVSSRLEPAIESSAFTHMRQGGMLEYAYAEQHQFALALGLAPEFDVVHSHVGPSAYWLSAVAGVGARVLHTIHRPLYADMGWFVARHPDLWWSTVSDFQASKLRGWGARRCETIYNGVDVRRAPFGARGGEDLAFVGRLEAAKGPDIAIRVARRLGRRLRLAGPIVDREFFSRSIERELDANVSYVGTLGPDERDRLLAQTGCVLMPSRNEEAFGMVAVEAMACGTPVVAPPRGALPEIVEPGVTGYLGDTDDEVAEAVERALRLDRPGVRSRVAERFDLKVAAEKYLALYEKVAGSVP